MTARAAMLRALRTVEVPVAAPAAPVMPVAPTDLVGHFLTMVASVGGTPHRLEVGASLEDVIAHHYGLERQSVCVAPGRFGVAENGAVYVDAADLPDRVSIVRAEHLVLTVAAQQLVPTMHEAVRRMPLGSACGWFLSGPSKTADIEQALVIGAQGARSLLVVLTP